MKNDYNIQNPFEPPPRRNEGETPPAVPAVGQSLVVTPPAKKKEASKRGVTASPIFHFDDWQAQLHTDFAEYLKGKRVAIVGKGCPFDYRQGDKIDAYDVVVRVHWPIPYHDDIMPGHTSEQKPGLKWDPPPFVPKKWQPIVGSKTNIFYTTIKGGDPKWCQNIVDAFKDEGGQFICEWHPGSQAAGWWSSGRLAYYHPVRQLNVSIFQYLLKELGSEPLGGTCVLLDICRHQVDEVYLTGLQCFVSEEYPDGITPGRPKNDVVPLDNFKFVRQFVRDHKDRITIDPNMAKMFSIF